MNAFCFVLVALLLSVCHGQSNHDDTDHPHNVTTTRKPDTTTPTTTKHTTTPKPDTTTNPPTTTTVKPSPETPDVVAGNITSDKNATCLRYHFTLLMRLAHNTTDNKTEFMDKYLPKNAIVDSDHCSNEKMESFWFKFDNGKSLLNLTFTKNEASVYLASITGKIYLEKANTSVNLDVKNPNPNFTVDKSHSYVCANNISIKADCHQSELLFSDLKLQAFMPESQKGQFSEEHNCQNEISDVVPIAVGAALTALVIIVMIAYFIGRRRSRRTAYQSV